MTSALALEDGRIGVLYISDPIRAPGFDFMKSEPIFSMRFVAASLRGFGGWELEDVHRAIRLYMPRTFEDTTSWFDVIVLDNANRNALSIGHIEVLARAVKEAKLGLLMTGGSESFGGAGTAEPPWGTTAIGKLLPTEDVEDTWVMSGRLIILKEDHEYISSIPWERKSPFMTAWHHNLVKVRQGAELLAISDKNTFHLGGKEHPILVTWELQEGSRVFACTGEIAQSAIFLNYGGVSYTPWEYYGDLHSNLMIYLAIRPVPQDVDLVHSVRSKAFQIMTRTSLLLNLLEFIEDFGASTQAIMRDIDETNGMIVSARQDYIELRFEQVTLVYDEIFDILEKLERQAIELKDRALLWVYLIEWLSVMGVSLLAGFLLWTLMVRRRLYKEIGTTRMVDAYQ
jgi:uncharacterized membrane protein